jgi:hypothetical protein
MRRKPCREWSGKTPVTKLSSGQIYHPRQSSDLHFGSAHLVAWRASKVGGRISFQFVDVV